jgi:hypothetical protein
MGRIALYPDRTGRRPPTFTPPLRQVIVDVALSRPKGDGYAIGPWTLDRERDTVVMTGIVASISKERLRETLHEEAVSFQAAKTWKESTDPKFREKVERLRALPNRKQNPPIVGPSTRWDRSRCSPTAVTRGLGRGTPTECRPRTNDSAAFAI